MIKKFLLMAAACAISPVALAQLAADPWQNEPPPHVSYQAAKPAQSAPNTLHQQLPEFVGENTTWNTAMGQKEIAPDVNITNMLLMTQHLRNMGYQIPDGLDNLINTAPEKLRREISIAMNQVKSSSHPFAIAERNLEQIFEKNTGLSLTNLIGNSLRIIDARR